MSPYTFIKRCFSISLVMCVSFSSSSELSWKGFGMAPSLGGTAAGCLSLSFANDLIRFKVTKVIPIHSICHREAQTRIYLKYDCCDYLLQHRVKDQNGEVNRNDRTVKYKMCISSQNKNKSENQHRGGMLGAWSFVLKSAHFTDDHNWTRRQFCVETDLSQDFQGSARQASLGWLASSLCCLEGHFWSLWTLSSSESRKAWRNCVRTSIRQNTSLALVEKQDCFILVASSEHVFSGHCCSP